LFGIRIDLSAQTTGIHISDVSRFSTPAT
jgi:hypothetical protein